MSTTVITCQVRKQDRQDRHRQQKANKEKGNHKTRTNVKAQKQNIIQDPIPLRRNNNVKKKNFRTSSIKRARRAIHSSNNTINYVHAETPHVVNDNNNDYNELKSHKN